MRPIVYNFRQAKKEWERRQGGSPLDVILSAVKNTPGAWGQLFKFQKECMFPETKKKEEGDDNIVF